MIDEATMDNIIRTFQTKLGMTPVGKEKNLLKALDTNKLFTFRFDLTKQSTEVNFYMLQPPVKGIPIFPLYMQSLVVTYNDKKPDTVVQEILQTLNLFDYSKEALVKKITETMEVNTPKE